MADLSVSQEKQLLGEVFSDTLQAIYEYVKDIPLIKTRLDQIETNQRNHTSQLSNHDFMLRLHQQQLHLIEREQALQRRELAAIKRK